ncbi:MAG: hypothetical protein HMLKMBBP_00886 [Planctomycetes bacterium]|nr:hypothetical protein [Planctomycetota bacterium]
MTGSAAPLLDAVVVGAGFGGLGAAMEFASKGRRAVVCEALTYPGGCAGAFRRGGYGFDAGATLAAGFAEGQRFRTWIDDLGLRLETSRLDPVVEFRAAGIAFPVSADRAAFAEMLCRMPDAPTEAVRSFLATQRRVADALWPVLDDPELLPPIGLRGVLKHAARIPRYAAAARWAGRSLAECMRVHGVLRWTPLRTFADAVSQITVQCSAEDAEAPTALAALDYFWRGAVHVRGGIGALAAELVRSAGERGVEFRFATRVLGLRRDGPVWIVRTNRGDLRARRVVANVLPQGLCRLVGTEIPGVAPLAVQVETGWGAAMLYLVLRDGPEPPRHLQLVDDPSRPLVEGNHVFLSISGSGEGDRAPHGYRTATASTHVRLPDLRSLGAAEQGEAVAAIQSAMRRTLGRRAPEWWSRVTAEFTASPRTFERFTGRDGGFVGGVPKRRGLANYRSLGPIEALPGLFIAGDSAFPGQSALAAALCGMRAATASLSR